MGDGVGLGSFMMMLKFVRGLGTKGTANYKNVNGIITDKIVCLRWCAVDKFP